MRSKSVPVNLLIRKIHTALGDGGEEGSPEESEEKVDTEEDNRSITPNSNSPSPVEDGQSPSPGDIPSPSSPRSINEESSLRRRSTSRCNSRESSDSQLPFSSCPPADSERMFAERAALLHHNVPVNTELSPVGVSLPPSIPAALLPSQSAAMAAYLNAAAAAAVQSHRLMMTSPLPRTFPRPPDSPLIGATSSPPSGLLMPHVGELSPNSEGILDYSRKAISSSKNDESGGVDVVNLSKTTTSVSHGGESGTAPLDLSFSSRKRTSDEPLTQTPSRKAKMDYKPSIPPWPPSIGAQHLPYFAAAVAAAGLSPKNHHSSDLWNGKVKPIPPAPSDATKALEKMSELSKIGGSSDELFRSMPGNSTSNRHSAWQSHWLNKGAEQAKDVLKCVWCKQSFPSLAALTTHMKEAKHCGVNVPVPSMQPSAQQPQISSSPSSVNTIISTSSNSTKPTQSDLNMLIKETMPLPRKLVRGQDVWLGKGAEQTRQILKCMWCGQSFRSLAEMTSHMQQTQHYTNIISQEQIISWRSTDDGKSTVGSSGGNNQTPTGGTSSHVSAVLTCKVCDQAFSSLKELSNHMVKNSHYKEHIMRSITESGGRRRQTREKRKKSLPVRKLLELERAQNGDGSSILDKLRDPSGGAAGRITCEKCNNKIETSMFVDHIRQCVGGLSSNQRNFLKTALMPNNVILPPESPERNKMKTPSDKSPSPTPSVSDKSTKESSTGSGETNNGSSPSVLNAIEKLIEKSFDSRSRQNPAFPGQGHNQAPIGSSILKRLGIDESVDYTKPLVDPQTMNLLRSYHQQHYNNRRERSGSESSSMSERGFGRVDSLTPEGKMEPPLSGIPLSATPEIKREKSPIQNETTEITVKKEVEDSDTIIENLPPPSSSTIEGVNLKIKKEKDDDNNMVDNHHHDSHNYANGEIITKDDEEKRRVSPSQASTSGEPSSSAHHHHSPASSPSASSDRSGTPRSTTSDRKSEGGSLGALSSMFDSLSGANNLSENSSNKKASNHPLAALQKLCDKTDNHTNNRAHSSSSSSAQSASTSSSTTSSANIPSCSTPNSITTTPGAILAFSWACNDAVVTPDAIMKCAFCDTPFISKGAYRHHLSKMHFVKDGVIPDPVALKSTASTSSGSSVGVSLKGSSVLPSGSSSATSPKSPPSAGGFEESPHSKFLKYTELAKQLSSKYV